MGKTPDKKARTRKGLKLFDRDKWTVVAEPPGEAPSVTRFTTEADADGYMYRLKGVGKDRHAYKNPPQK